ncbi:heterokaryon incompatibility protein [Colletotrichum truncatum]|uniref:Heterokaryon incompatibility protein n=1 Tax=Colletotrichum truncatum TaxID=5467 RepID=A0ACC3ZD28_COLTU|nr:heterokaryon incompatibility protein [Colletotrichum truncatum]KAF6797944.1 heterokaryon incompatibility protein [Colletotrichum truncatum]
MSYTYGMLPQGHIRLLVLQPGNTSDALSCSFYSTPLESAPVYEAVSYACDTLELSDTLNVLSCPGANLEPEPQILPITQCLSSLLRSLRHTTEPRTIWLDAVSINPRNIAEKNSHVLRMRHMYSQARRVILWLGLASDDGSTDRAFTFLKRMAMHKKWADRGHYMGSRRLGSDTSSECGIGMCQGESDNESEEEDSGDADEGYGSDSTADVASEDSDTNGDETADSPQFSSHENIATYLDEVEMDDTPHNAFYQFWRRVQASLDRMKDFAYRRYHHYFVLGWWNPLFRWRISKAWDSCIDAWALNATRVGHIAFGRPILYENDMGDFFVSRYADDWAAVDRLLLRPWWSRVWVVPEVWSASDATILQCGPHKMKWKTFQKALPYEETWDDIQSVMTDNEGFRLDIWPQLKKRYKLALHLSKKRLLSGNLSDLLWNTWDREAVDPRDKVFAISSLVGKNEGLTPPDYHKTTRQVFCETARDIILTEGNLDILLAAGGPKDPCNGGTLPSWVPDWRSKALDRRPHHLVDRSRLRSLLFTHSVISIIVNGHGYTACGQESKVARFGPDLSTLQVHAVVMDEVGLFGTSQEHEIVELGPVVEDACTVAKATFEQVIPSWCNGYVVDDLPALVRTVMMGGSRGEKTEEEVISNTMPLRRFFTTKAEKRLCIGPALSNKGDKICIIAGCNFPLVLRQIRDEKGQDSAFQLIGEAYVHGIMNGEAIAALKRRTWWEKLAWWRRPKDVNWETITIY